MSTTFDNLTVADLTPTIGSSETKDFTGVNTAIDTQNNIVDLCGSKTYSVLTSGDVAHTWISVAAKTGAANTYTITASPTADNLAGVAATYKLKVVLDKDNTVTRTYTFNITPAAATCSCANIEWEAGSTATKTVNVGTPENVTLNSAIIKSASVGTSATDAAVRRCYTQSSPVNC